MKSICWFCPWATAGWAQSFALGAKELIADQFVDPTVLRTVSSGTRRRFYSNGARFGGLVLLDVDR